MDRRNLSSHQSSVQGNYWGLGAHFSSTTSGGVRTVIHNNSGKYFFCIYHFYLIVNQLGSISTILLCTRCMSMGYVIDVGVHRSL